MSLEESELGLQAVVDPYARADFFISFSDEEVAVEEGFLTFTALPWDLLVKVGRMQVAFGKINTLHLHVLAVAGRAAARSTTCSAARRAGTATACPSAKLIPLGDTFSELTLQVVDGDRRACSPRRRAPTSPTTATTGCSATSPTPPTSTSASRTATGHNGVAGDTTTRASALSTSRSAGSRCARAPTARSSCAASCSAAGASSRAARRTRRLVPRGRLPARAGAGSSACASKLPSTPTTRRSEDTGVAATLTFWPSEFSQLRGEVRRRRYGGPNDVSVGTYTANEVLLQLQFAIGAHGAHPF